eukprot:10554500-Alexandrium_andersonii.AAC.2
MALLAPSICPPSEDPGCYLAPFAFAEVLGPGCLAVRWLRPRLRPHGHWCRVLLRLPPPRQPGLRRGSKSHTW